MRALQCYFLCLKCLLIWFFYADNWCWFSRVILNIFLSLCVSFLWGIAQRVIQSGDLQRNQMVHLKTKRRRWFCRLWIGPKDLPLATTCKKPQLSQEIGTNRNIKRKTMSVSEIRQHLNRTELWMLISSSDYSGCDDYFKQRPLHQGWCVSSCKVFRKKRWLGQWNSKRCNWQQRGPARSLSTRLCLNIAVVTDSAK